ncbi:MAG: Lrp/AsnC family transcriptional regulator [Alphaproteobacteria bacterium]|nr:MAG: Lrp/AsnC family transcriptional regulator [Alphaproteobacteria bacterium]
MDEFDRKILRELQRGSDRSVQEVADAIGLSPTPTARRIRLLRQAGYIRKEVALLDRQRLGIGETVYVMVKTNAHTEDWLQKFAEGVARIPEVIEFHRMSGEIDYLIKIAISGLSDYDRIYKKLIAIVPLSDVSSSFSMECIKETTEVPIS